MNSDQEWLLDQEARDTAREPGRQVHNEIARDLIDMNRGEFDALVARYREEKPPEPPEATDDGILPEGGRRHDLHPREAEAREYLKSGGPFDHPFLQSIGMKFIVEHPTWHMSFKQVDAVLKFKANDRKRATVAREHREPVEPGMYRKDDVIYKVQKAVHGSGRPYAKRLVRATVTGRVFGTVDQGRWTFEYDKGAVYTLTAADKMTLEEAKAFGALYGTCCVCGRTLTDERSIEAGIGPVCAGKGNWR